MEGIVNEYHQFCKIGFKIYFKWMVYSLTGSRGSQIAKFMGPTWGPPGSCRPQMGPMLTPWALLSGLRANILREIGKRLPTTATKAARNTMSIAHTPWWGWGFDILRVVQTKALAVIWFRFPIALIVTCAIEQSTNFQSGIDSSSPHLTFSSLCKICYRVPYWITKQCSRWIMMVIANNMSMQVHV